MKLIWLNEDGEVQHVRRTSAQDLIPGEGSGPAMFTFGQKLPNLCKVTDGDLFEIALKGEIPLVMDRIRKAMHVDGRIEVVPE